jgi:hypothetical protein
MEFPPQHLLFQLVARSPLHGFGMRRYSRNEFRHAAGRPFAQSVALRKNDLTIVIVLVLFFLSAGGVIEGNHTISGN